MLTLMIVFIIIIIIIIIVVVVLIATSLTFSKKNPKVNQINDRITVENMSNRSHRQ